MHATDTGTGDLEIRRRMHVDRTYLWLVVGRSGVEAWGIIRGQGAQLGEQVPTSQTGTRLGVRWRRGSWVLRRGLCDCTWLRRRWGGSQHAEQRGVRTVDLQGREQPAAVRVATGLEGANEVTETQWARWGLVLMVSAVLCIFPRSAGLLRCRQKRKWIVGFT